MKRILYSILISSAGFLTGCKEPAVKPTAICINRTDINHIHPKAADFQHILNTYIAKGLPGATLLISDENGIWTGSAGKADIEKGIDMEPCHIIKTASITKLFMGALSFKLVEEGYYKLDDPISKYLPEEVIEKVKNARQSTIRMLMAHQTGIYDVISDNGFYLAVLNNPNKEWDQLELLKYVYGKDPKFEAGSTAGYSNTNTLLLSMVMEKATGKDHGTLLHEKIINPLQLKDTYYHTYDKLPEGKVAQGYYDLYNNQTLANLSNWITGNGNGYNGIYSTVSDLYTFIEALFINKILIAQSSLDQMLTFHPQEETGKYLGAGAFKDFIHRGPDEYGYGHRGRDINCSGDLFYFPEKQRTFALLVNYGNDGESSLKPVYFELLNQVVDQLMK